MWPAKYGLTSKQHEENIWYIIVHGGQFAEHSWRRFNLPPQITLQGHVIPHHNLYQSDMWPY